MVSKTDIIEALKVFFMNLLDVLQQSNPVIRFTRPLISNAINNNIYRVEEALNIIADKDGNIDASSILDEMIDNVINLTPFKIPTGVIGDIDVGNGNIVFNIPMIGKLKITSNDIREVKNLLLNR